jgi:hypothetical protein
MIQKYKLNMLPHAERTYRGYIPPKVNVSQYDKGLRTLVFDLYDGDQAYTLPENATAKIYGKKPDQNVFEYDMTIDASGEVPTVSIALQEQMAVIAGMVECEVRIFSGSQTAGTGNFLICVEPAPVGAEEAYSESEIPEIDNLLYGGTAGQVFTKTPTGAHWADLGTSSNFMLKSEYDPNDDGSVLKADHADDADTVDGFTVARNVLADEYTNSQIDTAVQAVSDAVSQLDGEVVKKVNNIAPVDGNVALAKADIGLGNVDNTSDANKPISTATQAALDLKVDKEAGKGLSTNDFTTAEKEKLAGIAAGAEVNVQANWNETDQTADSFIQNKPSIPSKTSDLTNDSGFVTDAAMQSALDQKVDKVAGKGLSTEDFTTLEKTKLDALPTAADLETSLNGKVDKEAGKGLSSNDFTTAEKTKLEGIEDGAQVNTITGVKGDAEATYRTGNVNITKTNIGLGNVDNTSDLDKPISTATQTALDGKQATLTFDSTPTAGSTNPVTSGGIATEISAINNNLSSKVSSVNSVLPDSNGNVEISASDIPANGMGTKETSGNPIEIEDGVAENAQDLSIELEPIQDLHGYNHPWVGGAGKNLLDSSGAAETTDDGITSSILRDAGGNIIGIKFTGTCTAAEYYYRVIKSNMVFPAGSYILSGCPANGSTETYRLQITGQSANDYGSGKLVTFSEETTANVHVRITAGFTCPSEGLIFKPMIRLSSVSDATFEPYSNICPITGRTAVDVNRTGKNLINIPDTVLSSASYLFNGDISLPSGSYVFSITKDDGAASASAISVAVVMSNGNNATITRATSYENRIMVFITASESIVSMRIYATAGTYSKALMESGSIATAYEPYQGQFVTVQLGQTVYGGTVNVTTGELVVRTANIASYNGEIIGEPWWSSMDEYVAGTTPTTGAQVVYTLANPVTATLTPAQLQLLEGYNLLTTDGDTIHLRYIGTEASNVQAEIDEFETVTNKLISSIAFAEQSTAIANHAVGDYIMLNGQFCVVTVAIATGESIIINTNASITTIGVELLKIIARLNAINA